ncbi:hypothetical protein AB4Z22_28630, partial [Paenibacillus sp. TAF58]
TYVVRDDEESLKRIAEIWAKAKKNRDDLQSTIKELLALTTVWGKDLTDWIGLAESICHWWVKEEEGGGRG